MAVERPKILISDGEGPLVFKDLARDIASKIEFEIKGKTLDGTLLFDTLSLYNGFLAESGNHPNKPGDTLALLVPHLLAHGITDEDLRREATNVLLANGAEDYLNRLRQGGWQIRVISTAYSALWNHVSKILGIPQEHIASTKLELAPLALVIRFADLGLEDVVKAAEMQVLDMVDEIRESQELFRNGLSLEQIFSQPAMRRIGTVLHHLYRDVLPSYGVEPLKVIKIVGGIGKVEALMKFRKELDVDLSDIAYVGDSITDDELHRFLKERGGLPIAVNSDYYGIRNAVVAVATEDMGNLQPVLEAWASSGLGGVRCFIEETQQSIVGKERTIQFEGETKTQYAMVPPDELTKRRYAQIHQEFRDRIRKTPMPIL